MQTHAVIIQKQGLDVEAFRGNFEECVNFCVHRAEKYRKLFIMKNKVQSMMDINEFLGECSIVALKAINDKEVING